MMDLVVLGGGRRAPGGRKHPSGGSLGGVGLQQPPLRLAPEELALEPGDLPAEISILDFEAGNALQVLSPLSLSRLALPQQRDDLCGTQRGGLVFQPHASLVSHRVPLPKGDAIQEEVKDLSTELLFAPGRRQPKPPLL